MPTFNEDFLIRANLTAETITAQSGNFSSAWLTALDQVDPVNNVFQFPVYYSQPIGATVASASVDVFIATEVCNLASFKVFNSTAPTGDRSFTVDLQKSTGGGAFATILSAVITRNSSDTDRTTESATISSAALIAGDVLRVVVAYTAGTTGTLPLGVTAQIMVEQNGQ